MSIIIPANTLAAGGFDVENSCMFDYASGDNVHKTPGSAGSGTKFVFSTWIKRTKLATAMNIIYAQTATNNYERIRFVGTDKIEISGVASGSTAYNFATDAVYRDPSAWMHLHVIRDSTQGTASNRLKVYVNGVLQALTQDTALSQNYSGLITGSNVHRIAIGNGEPLGAYLAEVILLDGQVITPDGNTGEFDEDSGVWKPIDVSGLTFGTTGFHLDFQASGNLGNDANGGDDFTEVNLAATNQSTDTCTNNFSTFNGVLKQMSTMALTEGNLQGATSSSHEGFFGSFFSSIGVTTGKWYAEFKCTGNANKVYVGISNNLEEDVLGSTTVGGKKAFTFAYKGNGWAYYGADGKIAHTDSNTFLSYGAALSNNDIVGVALDLDELEIYFSINGSFQNSGDPTSGSSQTGGVVTAGGAALTTGANSGTYYFCVSDNDQSTVCTVQANFGSPIHSISSGNADGNGFGNFEYAVPSGYLALCTKNLAENG